MLQKKRKTALKTTLPKRRGKKNTISLKMRKGLPMEAKAATAKAAGAKVVTWAEGVLVGREGTRAGPAYLERVAGDSGAVARVVAALVVVDWAEGTPEVARAEAETAVVGMAAELAEAV